MNRHNMRPIKEDEQGLHDARRVNHAILELKLLFNTLPRGFQ